MLVEMFMDECVIRASGFNKYSQISFLIKFIPAKCNTQITQRYQLPVSTEHHHSNCDDKHGIHSQRTSIHLFFK